jgi:hypothetical protein
MSEARPTHTGQLYNPPLGRCLLNRAVQLGLGEAQALGHQLAVPLTTSQKASGPGRDSTPASVVWWP